MLKKTIILIIFSLFQISSFAESGVEKISKSINDSFAPIVDFLNSVIMWDINSILGLDIGDNKIPFVVVWLILGSIFFTIKMRFVNFRGFGHAIALVSGKHDNPKDKGEVSHFQALTTALSATVGLGNIAGVAIAISIGGPGATFWMIVAGLLGMSSKFTEVTLGVKYRKIDKNGEVSGGPMYYLSDALKARKMKYLGLCLAILFAILVSFASFAGGNMFQANQAFAQMTNVFPSLEGNGVWFGIILAVLVGIVIIGGIKSIARVTDKIVPFMAVIYVLAALIIIFANYNLIGEAFRLIIDGAFSTEAAKGGVVGVLIVGFQRAAFSNEAGVGSASIAHAAVKTKKPVSEGIVSLLEPFIDTVIICTMTALVIVITGEYANHSEGSVDGVKLTSLAFESVLPWFKYILAIAVFLFAFSTMISWSYYGLKGFDYLFSPIIKRKKTIKLIYQIIFITFVIIGTSLNLGKVVALSDMMILGMAFPNIIGLIILSSEVKFDLKKYFKNLKK